MTATATPPNEAPPPEAPPKLRPDLVASRQETPEGVFVVLKDPRSGRYFRFREPEYGILRRLDGATPLDQVSREAAAEFDVAIDEQTLRPFVDQVRRRGLLDDPNAPPPTAGGAFKGNLLWLRMKAVNPDRLLDRMIGKVRFFFTPQFVVINALLMTWAVVTVALSHDEIAADIARLWRLENLLVAWLTILTVTTLHEFAHGLTCKHFGGKVTEMGFLLIYLQPAFYCNVSDAWLFPKKSHRVWVTFAGGFFELFLWAVATLVWRVTERATWISDVALIVMATSGVKQFFNLNPLIKLDGYYLLADLIDMPNLRPRAFGYLIARAKRLLFGREAVPELPAATPRERRIYYAYGTVAMVWSYWLLYAITTSVAGYFVEQFRGWGFAMAMVLTAAVVANSTGKSILPSPSRVWKPGRRAKVVLLAAATLVLLTVLELPLRVAGEFQIAPAANADVRAQVEGIIEEVYVEEGQRVEAGQPIVRLSDRTALSRLRMVEAEVREKQARLAMLRAGPRREEIEASRASLGKVEDRLRFGRADLDRVRALAQAQAASRTELDQAEERVAVLQKERDEAQARLRALEAGSRPEEIAALEQDILRSQAERQQLEGDLQRVNVAAPHGGVVVTPRMREKIGALVTPGHLVAEVHATETVRAEISVPERDIGDLQVGQSGSLRLRAYPGRTFTGRVTRIAPAADSTAQLRVRTVRVTIQIPNDEGLLKPHLTGYARIDCGTRRAIDLLTRGIRRYLRVEFWSWW